MKNESFQTYTSGIKMHANQWSEVSWPCHHGGTLLLATKAAPNKRPNGPVSFTWFYIFLYQSMTKGCYTSNINAFRPVIHRKKCFKFFAI